MSKVQEFPKTAQSMFDITAAHLIQQGRRSGTDEIGCAYRGSGGLECAVGCCIPDSLYIPEMEGDNARAVMNLLGVKSEGMIELAMRLQNVHDMHRVIQWPEMLRNIAGDYGLSTGALEAALVAKEQS